MDESVFERLDDELALEYCARLAGLKNTREYKQAKKISEKGIRELIKAMNQYQISIPAAYDEFLFYLHIP